MRKDLKARREYLLNKYGASVAAEAWRTAPQAGHDNGAFGKLFEMQQFSNNTKVHASGQADGFIIVDGKRVACEAKTNGGDLTATARKIARGKSGLLLYTLNVCNSNTKGKARAVPPLLFSEKDFFDIVQKYAARKPKGEKLFPIEPSKMDFYLFLLDYYDEFGQHYAGTEYTQEDIDERHAFVLEYLED